MSVCAQDHYLDRREPHHVSLHSPLIRPVRSFVPSQSTLPHVGPQGHTRSVFDDRLLETGRSLVTVRRMDYECQLSTQDSTHVSVELRCTTRESGPPADFGPADALRPSLQTTRPESYHVWNGSEPLHRTSSLVTRGKGTPRYPQPTLFPNSTSPTTSPWTGPLRPPFVG